MDVQIFMQDNKSIHVVAMICAILVHTDTQTNINTYIQTDYDQLYMISSASDKVINKYAYFCPAIKP